ncbi:MAG: pilus assembly protein MshP [Gammaproteobacteria bacterium]|nr:pilus assembly protein MshP [Gammaproteobacteria bacterium]
MMNRARRQRGFSIIAVIFIILLLAVLGGFLVVVSSSAQQTGVAALATSRAYHAARAGLEWGIHQAVVNGGVGVAPDPCNGGFTLAAGGFDNESVTVTCTSSVHRDGNPPTDVRVYVITAIATTGTEGSLNYARRELQAVVSPSGPL